VRLVVFASQWALGSFQACRDGVSRGTYDGIEGPVPTTSGAARELRRALEADGVPWLAEVCTGGDYAPATSVSFEAHFADLAEQVQRAAEAGPVLINCLAGSDSWPLALAVEFYERALAAGERAGVELSFETHRSRPTFNPWSTRDLLLALPALRITCDFSHWCAVCERLVDDESVLSLAVERARHVHARVGYAQGPQVPDPRAPEFARELEAHEGWWNRIWSAAEARGASFFPMTPEFGPDGYLHHLPFTDVPVADLSSINGWMATRQKARFAGRTRLG
jgi:hypothetical protein